MKINPRSVTERKKRAADLYWYLQKRPAKTLDEMTERIIAISEWFAREYRLGIDAAKRKAKR